MATWSSPQLLLFFLLMAASGSRAKPKIRFRVSRNAMNWTEARQFCQGKYFDMVSLSLATPTQMYNALLQIEHGQDAPLWVGLHRDPSADAVWREIDLRMSEGFTGSNFSTHKNWVPGDQDPHCAAVEDRNQTWHSQLCWTPKPFYCSSQNITLVASEYSWEAAASYCHDNSTTLATVNAANSAHFNRRGWIGLHRGGSDTWEWSDGSPVAYTNWAAGEPRTRDCGSFNSTSLEWHSYECSHQLHAFCFFDNLAVVKLEKTWDEAVAHCRQLQMECSTNSCVPTYDLVTPTMENHNIYISHRSYREGTTDEVWVGLRFLAGAWWGLDGQLVPEEASLPSCPSEQERCVTIPKHNYQTWLLRDCSERRHFICNKI